MHTLLLRVLVQVIHMHGPLRIYTHENKAIFFYLFIHFVFQEFYFSIFLDVIYWANLANGTPLLFHCKPLPRFFVVQFLKHSSMLI